MRPLADRLTEHLRSIRNNFLGLSVAAHFNSSGLSIFNAQLSVITICANDTQRKAEEERRIHKQGTLEPRGMTVRFHSFAVSIETINYIKQYIYNYFMLFCHVAWQYVSIVSTFFKLLCRY